MVSSMESYWFDKTSTKEKREKDLDSIYEKADWHHIYWNKHRLC